MKFRTFSFIFSILFVLFLSKINFYFCRLIFVFGAGISLSSSSSISVSVSYFSTNLISGLFPSSLPSYRKHDLFEYYNLFTSVYWLNSLSASIARLQAIPASVFYSSVCVTRVIPILNALFMENDVSYLATPP